ncbi:MAG: TetR/AcrR family transcriptional regulator [Alphaproteobacteria bacterium]|uniref:TetR/AcrR family transcriptional regulator n=1 Tax=Aestuariivirga sp. TaxID=2650926 RepID=UPI00301869DD|nr:TetR/AcrR family transcriptional regulator [Alphaproteobacteria bacterium]
MSGLRERQKAIRHDRIIEAATRLFQEQGYETVKMEAIAAAAEVAIGTIYNYYRNKGDLLVAIVSLEVEEVLRLGEQVIAAPPPSAEAAVDALIGGYVEHSLHYLSKEMWRQAMAISTTQPTSPFGETYAALDVALARQTCQLLEKLQELGLLSRAADAGSLGEVIFNNTNMNFMVFVKDADMTLAELRNHLRRQHDAVLTEFRIVGAKV